MRSQLQLQTIYRVSQKKYMINFFFFQKSAPGGGGGGAEGGLAKDHTFSGFFFLSFPNAKREMWQCKLHNLVANFANNANGAS